MYVHANTRRTAVLDYLATHPYLNLVTSSQKTRFTYNSINREKTRPPLIHGAADSIQDTHYCPTLKPEYSVQKYFGEFPSIESCYLSAFLHWNSKVSTHPTSAHGMIYPSSNMARLNPTP